MTTDSRPPAPRPGSVGASAPTPPLPVTLPSPRECGDDAVGCVGPAWIVREITHVPGVLTLAGGRLRFRSSRGPVFDVTGAEMSAPGTDLALLPWHGRTGFRITVGGERLRVHVVRPAGTVAPAPGLVAAAVADAPGLVTTTGDAAAAAVWRPLLLSALGRPRRPAARFAVRHRPGSAGSSRRS